MTLHSSQFGMLSEEATFSSSSIRQSAKPFTMLLVYVGLKKGTWSETEYSIAFEHLPLLATDLNYPELLPQWPLRSVGRASDDLIRRSWVQTPACKVKFTLAHKESQIFFIGQYPEGIWCISSIAYFWHPDILKRIVISYYIFYRMTRGQRSYEIARCFPMSLHDLGLTREGHTIC